MEGKEKKHDKPEKKERINKKKTEKKNNKKTKPGLSAVLKIALIFFVAVSIIFIAARSIGGVTLTGIVSDIKVFFQSLGWGDGYPYKTSGESARQIYIDGSRVFVYSEDKTLLLSSSAKNIAEIPIEYGKPEMKFKNGKALIYDRDSSKFRIQSTSEIVTEKEAGGVILSAAIGKKGNFAVAWQGSGVKNTLTVYNKKESEIFSYEFNGEKVTDIDLSDDGKYAVLSTIKSENAQVNSKVYVFRFDSEEYVSCFDFENNAVISVKYDNSHNIVIIGSAGRTYVKDNTTLGDTVGFESDILFKASSYGKYNAVALKKYGGDNYGTVLIFKGNEQTASVSVNKEIKDVYCTDKYTAVLTPDSVLVYKNKNGDAVGEASAELSATEIVLKKKKIYMMSPSEIICQKF